MPMALSGSFTALLTASSMHTRHGDMSRTVSVALRCFGCSVPVQASNLFTNSSSGLVKFILLLLLLLQASGSWTWIVQRNFGYQFEATDLISENLKSKET